MPSYFAWKLLQILLISRSSFALDSNSYLAPLNSLDGGPPVSFATAENGVTGNFVADSNIGLTGEPINDPQPSDLFNSPNTLVQLSEGDSNACLRGTDISPNRRRRGKRERQSCDSNLFLAPGAGKKPTAPAGLHDHESGQQQKPSSSHQDQKKEPSADTKADPNNESPCNDEEYIHALCGPVSASWQIGSMNARTLRFMLGAANTWVPPGCVQPDVAWCCKIVAPRPVVIPTYEAYLLAGGECLPQTVLNFMRRTFGFK